MGLGYWAGYSYRLIYLVVRSKSFKEKKVSNTQYDPNCRCTPDNANGGINRLNCPVHGTGTQPKEVTNPDGTPIFGGGHYDRGDGYTHFNGDSCSPKETKPIDINGKSCSCIARDIKEYEAMGEPKNPYRYGIVILTNDKKVAENVVDVYSVIENPGEVKRWLEEVGHSLQEKLREKYDNFTLPEEAKPADVNVMASTESALNVCICGQHKEGYVPIKDLEGKNIRIFYLDPTDQVIKPWQPEATALSPKQRSKIANIITGRSSLLGKLNEIEAALSDPMIMSSSKVESLSDHQDSETHWYNGHNSHSQFCPCKADSLDQFHDVMKKGVDNSKRGDSEALQDASGSGGVESERMPEREVEQQPLTKSTDIECPVCDGLRAINYAVIGKRLCTACNGTGKIKGTVASPQSTSSSDIDDLLHGAFVGLYMRNENGEFVPMEDKYSVLYNHFKKEIEEIISHRIVEELEALREATYKRKGAKQSDTILIEQRIKELSE